MNYHEDVPLSALNTKVDFGDAKDPRKIEFAKQLTELEPYNKIDYYYSGSHWNYEKNEEEVTTVYFDKPIIEVFFKASDEYFEIYCWSPFRGYQSNAKIPYNCIQNLLDIEYKKDWQINCLSLYSKLFEEEVWEDRVVKSRYENS